MNDNFEITVFEPAKATEEQWKAYLDHSDAIFAEYEPGESPLPREKRRAMAAMAAPYARQRTYQLSCGGRADAAFASVSVESPGSPSYQDNRHMASLNLTVLPDFRRRGLGRALLARVGADLALGEPQVTELLAGASLDSGKRFLESLGAEVALEQAENRLQLGEVDWVMVEAWAAGCARRNPSTSLRTVTSIPEEDVVRYCETYTETLNQDPHGGVSGKLTMTPEQLREMEARGARNGIEVLTVYAKEADGGVSGLTEIAYMKEQGFKARQLLTGVRGESRARGIGKLVKAEMLLHVRRNYPGVKYLVAANADANAAMAVINNKLGFKRHRAARVYKLKLRTTGR